ALGERQRAIETLQRAGDQVGAARLSAGERLDGGPSLLGIGKQAAVSGAATSLLAAQKLESAGKLDAAFNAYVQLRKYADAARLATAMFAICSGGSTNSRAQRRWSRRPCWRTRRTITASRFRGFPIWTICPGSTHPRSCRARSRCPTPRWSTTASRRPRPSAN